jgi:glutamyl-tRNA reductase
MPQHGQTPGGLPISLLVKDRAFLVVGGGKVALRKVRSLLDAGADVTVVSPEAREELHDLVRQGRIRHLARIFHDDDLNGVYLAFAATNDKATNLRVLAGCRAGGVLCCAVDDSWPQGDFTTPATFRRGGLAVAVSSGGKACRRSRMLKDNLARHIHMVDSSELIVVGTSHNCLDTAGREPYHLVGQRLHDVGSMLMQALGLHEFMLLNTCNRIELIGVVADEPGLAPLLCRTLGTDRLAEHEQYVLRGFDAFRHMALVTAGLRSQSPGEEHIISQVKECVRTAADADWAGGVLRGWVADALHLSKDIRAAVAPLLKTGEIEDVCLHALEAKTPPTAGAAVLVVGTGIVGRDMVRRLVQRGYACDWCYHTNRPDVPDAWRATVKLHPLESLPALLPHAGAVVCAAAGSGHILHAGHAELFAAPVYDLGVPRNVAPEIRAHTLDDLKRLHADASGSLDRALIVAGDIVQEHRGMYDRIIQSLHGRSAGQ